MPNAQPTKQPGRKPGFRAAPLPRMSSFALPQRVGSTSLQPSYSMALATVQLKPVGKPPPPIIAPRMQPLKPRGRGRKRSKVMVPAEQTSADPVARTRRAGSPAFSEVDFNLGLEGEDDEPDILPTHIANEAESAMITRRLDDSLPRWEPWGNGDFTTASHLGWMPDLKGDILQARLEDFVSRMRGYMDAAQSVLTVSMTWGEIYNTNITGRGL